MQVPRAAQRTGSTPLAGLRDPGPRGHRSAELSEWTSPAPRPRHRPTTESLGVTGSGTWKYVATGVTAPPLQARKEAAGWGWPHARLRASRRTLGARRDQGGHGPVARAVVSTCMRPRASGTRRGEHLHAATGQPPAPPNNTSPASRSRGQGLQVAG